MINSFFKKYATESIAFIVLMCYSVMLNLQFLEGANVNYTFSGHDEYLTVREVFSILEPASFKHFFMGLVAGDIYFYGRMMFYTDALFAFLPYKIWGISALVFSIRMTHVLFLFLGVCLLGRTFLKNSLNRAFFYLGVLSLYYSAYFIIIPKPEPLQLFVLAVFLYYSLKNNWAYGKHFIFLGMAYGLKFNVLLILPLFFLLPAFNGQFKFKTGLVSAFYFLAGLLIAMPALLLSPIKPVFLKTYIKSTFKNTGHYDDTGATIIEWLKDGLFKYYGGNTLLGLIMFCLFLFLIGLLTINYFKTKKISSSLIVLLIGFCFLLPVILLTKRMWPHYLWTGFIFMALGLLTFLDEDILPTKRINVSKIFILTCFFITSLFSISRIISLKDLSEQSTEIVVNSSKAHNYLKNKSETFVAVQDISVWYPYKDFLQTGRYHPFSDTYPYEDLKQKISWIDFINPATIEKEKADYILTYLKNFETSIRRHGSLKDEMEGKGDSLMRLQLNKTVFLDTVFGKVRIYKVVHE
ncbi:hypothetical protein [Aurantibacillus circumpalustris]|uniref:hypothetical protein n=1 Tax=Aurantibacillus circumpalustris TaxID=3036359 RepID=UPI00295A6310|nr:hypothetical protein [Aurantibacillus circumpalustris]